MKYLLLFLLVLTGLMTAQAQDKIYKIGEKTPIVAKILEVNLDDIKYKDFDNLDGPTFSLEKVNIDRVVYATGRIESFSDPLVIAAVEYKKMNRNIVKVEFLNPLNGHLHMGFERWLKQGTSFELHADLIGVGKNRVALTRNTNSVVEKYYRNQLGLGVGASFKFILLGERVKRGEKMMHILQGTYIRPSAYLGSYNYNTYTDFSNSDVRKNKNNIIFGGLMIEGGRQWVFANRFALDIYVGVGLGLDNYRQSFNTDDFVISSFVRSNFFYTRYSTSDYLAFATNSGIKIGYLFNTKKDLAKLDPTGKPIAKKKKK